MAEYWKSTPKYWCKNCSTYVKDTPLERRQHESTAKHQANLKRFLRGIQNKHERDESEKQKAKAEVERLNKKVGVSSAASSPSPLPSAVKPSLKSKVQSTLADRKRQMAQLAEMGIEIPEEERGGLALAGEWKTISRTVVEEMQGADTQSEASLSVGVRKRRYEGDDEDEDTQTDLIRKKGWGSATKLCPEIGERDLDELLSKNTLPKVEPVLPPGPVDRQSTSDVEGTWQLTAPRPEKSSLIPSCVTAVSIGNTKQEEEDRKPAIDDIPEEVTSVAPVFKKRKPKTGGP